MRIIDLKNKRRERRKLRVRKKVVGTAERPRLTVFRSSQHLYAQIIDDLTGTTLCSASTRAGDLRTSCPYGGNVKAAKVVGSAIAEAAKAKNITAVAFDRNGYRYHGRVKALADAAREGGLKF